MRTDIQIDDQPVRWALNELRRAGEDLSPAMRVIAGALESGVQESFRRQQDPADGAAWADLSDVTKKRRAKRDKWPGQILRVTGDLARSISSRHSAREAMAGTNLPYAPTHQFGAAKGEFGTTKRGAPIPWGDIPARPFLGLSEDTRRSIVTALNRRLHAALRDASERADRSASSIVRQAVREWLDRNRPEDDGSQQAGPGLVERDGRQPQPLIHRPASA